MAEIRSLPDISRCLSGGACLSSRTIRSACQLFVSAPSCRPLPLAELIDGLWFLDQLIVSDHVSYDGTLPESDIDTLENLLEQFSEGSGFPQGHFRSIRPESFGEDQVPLMSAAAAALDDTLTFHRYPGLDQPFPDGIAEQFFQKLCNLAKLKERPSIEELEQIAKCFRGGKCIAGLALRHDFPTALKTAASTPSRLKLAPNLAMAVLVNRFRFTYVRHLAFGARDVFVPSAAWQPLSEAHANVFRILLNHFRSHLSQDDLQALSSSLNIQPTVLPPFGLCALMQAHRNARPTDVAGEAWDQFREYEKLFRKLRATIHSTQPPAGCWTDPTGGKILEHVEETLQKRLGKLSDRATNGSALERFIGFVMSCAPVARKVVETGVNVKLFVKGEPDPLLSVAVGAAVSEVVGRFLSASGRIARAHFTGHIDEYRQLQKTLSETNDLSKCRLAKQVKLVFGRELVL